MRLDVALTPALLTGAERKVSVVIDVLRATSSLAAMFARGLEEALVAETIEEARRIAEARDGWLLCGESHGLPPDGFDYGNSPTEFDRLDLRGKRAIVVTTNGTRALALASAGGPVFVGALVNAVAVARAASRAALAEGKDVVLMCAGNAGGTLFSLEDAFCAGALVELIERETSRLERWSSASAALRLYRSYANAAEALDESDHAQSLREIGLADDVVFCAQRDVFDVVPEVQRVDDGTLRVVAA